MFFRRIPACAATMHFDKRSMVDRTIEPDYKPALPSPHGLEVPR
jgi:hypothetical protein